MKFEKPGNKIGAAGQPGLIKEIGFIDGGVQETIIPGEDIVGKLFFKKTMKTLGKIGLKKMGAFVDGYDPWMSTIIKGYQEIDIGKIRRIYSFQYGYILIVTVIKYYNEACFCHIAAKNIIYYWTSRRWNQTRMASIVLLTRLRSAAKARI